MRIRVVDMGPADIAAITRLARRTWEHAYPGIITAGQIDYMLRQRYAADVIERELHRPDVWWDQILIDGRLGGFMSTWLDDDGRLLKIDKLYVAPERQRNGLGGRLLAHADSRAAALGCTALTLSVNKRNVRAIAAYRKHGFRITGSVCTDIGGGFVMDDHLMQRPVTRVEAAAG